MVSKRNYFSIAVMMGVLLFLFQFSMLAKDRGNEYDVNKNLVEKQEDGVRAFQMTEIDFEKNIPESGAYIAFVGNQTSGMKSMAEQWCLYTKRSLAVFSSLSEYIGTETQPEVLILESEEYVEDGQLKQLEGLADKGVTIIFGSLEDPSGINSDEELKNFLGISRVVAEERELTGVKIFEGFLLGGEVTYQAKNETERRKYQDLDLTVPWYLTASGTKCYMVGLLEDETIKNEYLPSLIWRNTVGTGSVFAVAGDYLKSSTGIGILDGMMLETGEYALYPVVNAQNLSVVNFPGFASENNEVMEKMYSRTQIGAYRDIIWPGLVAMSDQNRLKLTCFMMPQFNYMDGIEPDGRELIFYLKQFKEVDAEAGVSLEYIKGASLGDKVRRDGEFFSSQNIRYLYGAVFVNEAKIPALLNMLERPLLKNMGTIVCEYTEKRPVISYINDSITLQSVTNDAVAHTYSDDLRMRSIQSALGYTNIMLDMQRLSWPVNEDDRWEIMYEKFASNLSTYWKQYSCFASTTASESNGRIRNFLNLDYEQEKRGNEISLKVLGDTKEGWFILRTHGDEIEDIEGGSFQEIEEGAFLIYAEQENVTVRLKDDRPYYYLPQ